MPQAASAAAPTRLKKHCTISLSNLSVGTIGNVLEWYDFGLYGYLAPMIAGLFFPSTDKIASLLGAYAGFAIGFMMRPIGGVIFGHLGDRVGRPIVLVTSVVMMGLATTMVGLLPTYQQIGFWAPVLLLAVRLFQGLSVGGEFTGSVSYLVETAPTHRRGFAGSFANFGSTGGYLLAAGVAALTVLFVGHDAARGWVWRVPFLAGGVLAVLAYLVRSRLTDTSYELDCAMKDAELPIRQAFRRSSKVMVLATVFTWGYGVADYLTLVFLPTFAAKFGAISDSVALELATFTQLFVLLLIPVSGWLTDHLILRRTWLIASFGALLVLALPFFAMAQEAMTAFAIAQVVSGLLLGASMGGAPAMLSEQFRSEYRLSGYSLTFNVGLGIGGGTAPLIATALIGLTGFKLAAGAYLLVGCAMSVAALWMLEDRGRQPLR